MNASDVMVRNVVTIEPQADIATAVRLLTDHDISALPVVDDEGKVVGILSEADLLHREEDGTLKRRPWWVEAITPARTLALDYAKSHGQRVAEVMSEYVISASEDTPLSEVASILEKNRIKRVPILKDGKLVGIVSRANLIQALASTPPISAKDPVADRGVRAAILARLADQSWTGFGERNVVVSDGVVHLWGLVESPEEHKALLAIAESTPGVRQVSDEMIPSYFIS
ncbi:MAG TPA: CBS domain-containing protein [Methylocella sp.]|nr:CBS domain-containing protein [Methylocella sp.]